MRYILMAADVQRKRQDVRKVNKAKETLKNIVA